MIGKMLLHSVIAALLIGAAAFAYAETKPSPATQQNVTTHDTPITGDLKGHNQENDDDDD